MAGITARYRGWYNSLLDVLLTFRHGYADYQSFLSGIDQKQFRSFNFVNSVQLFLLLPIGILKISQSEIHNDDLIIKMVT